MCAIAGGKGGLGKTTTAINLARVRRDVVLLGADRWMANVGARSRLCHIESGASMPRTPSAFATVLRAATTSASRASRTAGSASKTGHSR